MFKPLGGRGYQYMGFAPGTGSTIQGDFKDEYLCGGPLTADGGE
jgi:hypothetical protein